MAWVHRRDQPELGQRDVGEPAACENRHFPGGSILVFVGGLGSTSVGARNDLFKYFDKNSNYWYVVQALEV